MVAGAKHRKFSATPRTGRGVSDSGRAMDRTGVGSGGRAVRPFSRCPAG